MQQLYLTGPHAPDIADRLFDALNIRPSGYRLIPFSIGGGLRGDALHLLTPPCAPMDNDVPCRIRLRTGDWTIVPRVLDEIAAPTLLQALTVHAPILLGGVTGQMLTCTRFREAVVQCLKSDRPVIVAASADAEDILRALTLEADQLWRTVPETAEDRAALLEELYSEAALRI